MAASAVSFNGTNTRYTRTALGLGGSFTMACWVKIVVDQNTYTSVLAQGDGASNYYHLGTGSTGTLFTRDSTSGAGANSGYDFPIGTWVYIATVNDTGAGNDLMGYKPAGGSWTPLALGAATVTGPSDTNTFYIGADSFGGWLNGSVAAVKIWTVALTDAELQAEAATYAPVKTSGLWAAYSFENGPQTNDESGNGRTLTAVGTPTTDASGPPISGGGPPPTFILTPIVAVPAMPMGG